MKKYQVIGGQYEQCYRAEDCEDIIAHGWLTAYEGSTIRVHRADVESIRKEDYL